MPGALLHTRLLTTSSPASEHRAVSRRLLEEGLPVALVCVRLFIIVDGEAVFELVEGVTEGGHLMTLP